MFAQHDGTCDANDRWNYLSGWQHPKVNIWWDMLFYMIWYVCARGNSIYHLIIIQALHGTNDALRRIAPGSLKIRLLSDNLVSCDRDHHRRVSSSCLGEPHRYSNVKISRDTSSANFQTDVYSIKYYLESLMTILMKTDRCSLRLMVGWITALNATMPISLELCNQHCHCCWPSTNNWTLICTRSAFQEFT